MVFSIFQQKPGKYFIYIVNMQIIWELCENYHLRCEDDAQEDFRVSYQHQNLSALL